MTTSNNAAALDFTITSVSRVNRKGEPSLRSVKLRLTDVAAPGVAWSRDAVRREIELTSFDGNAIEVYVLSSFTGIWMHQGTINSYAPNSHRPASNCSITATFARAWFGNQKSKAARKAFADSAARNY